MKKMCLNLLLCLSVCVFAKKNNIQQPTQLSTPKLVVGLVIDQMRWDYLYRFQQDYSNNGFNLLTREGYNCEYAHYNYVPTYTAPGHASIYTGTVPAIHGIIGNNWFDKSLNKYIYCASDANYKTIGSNTQEGQKSPKQLLTTTIGDELKISNNNQSKVIGIAIKDRSAIYPSGHNADVAYWFDGEAGKWITSSYYDSIKTIPLWVAQQNEQLAKDETEASVWKLLYNKERYHDCTADNVFWEDNYEDELAPVFPHNLSNAIQNNKEAFKALPYGNTMTLNMAKACIDGEQLGQDKFTDLLCVSLSSTDIIGHQFGCNAIEIKDMYLRLDNDISKFINYLDTKIGRNNYVLFLTADHGAANNASYLQTQHIPAGNEITKTFKQQIDSFQLSVFGKKIIQHISNQQVFLNHELIANNQELQLTKYQLIQFIKSIKGVNNVVDLSSLSDAVLPQQQKDLIINSFHPKRSGDLYIQLEPAWMEDYIKGTTHGSGYNYDTHIPLIFLGNGIPAKKDFLPIKITDIAPTISGILKIQEPNGCIGKPIIGVLKK